MQIMTGHVGSPHVNAEHFRMFLTAIFGEGSYIFSSGEKFAYTLDSNNLLTVKRGMMIHHGNISSVDAESGDQVVLTNGTQGMKRIDLIVNRYSKDETTGIESNTWVHIPGTAVLSDPIAPDYIAGNVLNGDTTDDCPVFELELDGLNITRVTPLLPTITHMQRQITSGTAEPSGGTDGDVYIQFE